MPPDLETSFEDKIAVGLAMWRKISPLRENQRPRRVGGQRFERDAIVMAVNVEAPYRQGTCGVAFFKEFTRPGRRGTTEALDGQKYRGHVVKNP